MPKAARLLALFALIALIGPTLPAQVVDQAAKREALHRALVAPLDNAPQRALVGQQIAQLNNAQL
ncbi:MAG: hypothetical protein QGH11_14180, partial [Pirellulaceae bacterium]|nr:hypothetical protein [Pirellulaceae bacterium]